MHPSTLGPQGPFSIKICKLLLTNAHRLVHPYLLSAAVVGQTNCHGFARVGGVRTAQYFSNFTLAGASAPRQEGYSIQVLPAENLLVIPQEGVPS